MNNDAYFSEHISENIAIKSNITDRGTHDHSIFADDKHDPCTIVIFGTSGDLTERKLIPALCRLFSEGGLPDDFLIVGCGRTEMGDAAFRDKMKEAISSYCALDDEWWKTFSSRLF